MKLSVIIPCFNAADTIATQLEGLSSQRWSEPWEVIVSDNGSTDGTLAIVEQYRDRLPNLCVVDSSDRQGSAHARNVGVLTAAGDMLAFCDADDEVASGWVAAMGKAISEHDFVASRFDNEKLNPSWVQKTRSNSQSDGLQRVPYPPYLLHAGGSGLGVKRSLHEAVGGFDESLLRLMDTDYCFRLQLRGAELHFEPNAVVYCRYRTKFGDLFNQARLQSQYNVFMYKKYRPPGMAISQPWRRYVNGWKHLLRRLPQIRSKAGRAAWGRRLAWQIGLLQGAVKYRIHPV